MAFWQTPQSNDDINRSLGRLEGKVDILLSRIDTDTAANSGRDDRINALERGQTRVNAYAAIVAFVISALVPFALSFLKIT